MTDEPKRRGRPPKAATVSVNTLRAAAGLDPAPDTTGVKVVLVTKRAMSKEGTREEATWPTGWPLPRAYDGIVHKGVQGPIRSITFDLDTGEIVISLDT